MYIILIVECYLQSLVFVPTDSKPSVGSPTSDDIPHILRGKIEQAGENVGSSAGTKRLEFQADGEGAVTQPGHSGNGTIAVLRPMLVASIQIQSVFNELCIAQLE
jgi:hypothetical protein